jgi:hypothetical protein
MEPTIAIGSEAILELIFERAGRYVVIGNVIVEGMMLELQEASPIVWPERVRELGDDLAFESIEARVEPWLTSLTLASYAHDEVSRIFRDVAAIRDDLATARAQKLYGATPLTNVMRSIAPYVYAFRFSRGAKVVIADDGGANGAALLYGRCAGVDFDCGDEARNAFVRRWFGAQTFGNVGQQRYDIAFIPAASTARADTIVTLGSVSDGAREIAVARPIPVATMVSFDPDDSVIEERFGVSTAVLQEPRQTVAWTPSPTGGSGGRVLLVARDDWAHIDDSDTDALRTLQLWLQREGFQVSVAEGWAQVDPSAVDLAHVVGHRHLGTSLPLLRRLAAARIPIVAAPYADDIGNEMPWGSQTTLFTYRSGTDSNLLDLYTGALARRKLIVSNAAPLSSDHVVPNPELAELLALSGAALVSGPEEERHLRDTYGYRRPILAVPAYLEPIAPTHVGALAGFDDFVLVHGPLDPANALLFVLAAAQREELPVIFSGQVANPEFLHYVKAYAGDRAFFVPPYLLGPAEIEGLYARARVYADVHWAGRGLNRVARAASYGSGLVVSTHAYGRDVLGDAACAADPGSIDSIAAALREAWDGAERHRSATLQRAAERFNPAAALVSTVTAYQYASQRQTVP